MTGKVNNGNTKWTAFYMQAVHSIDPWLFDREIHVSPIRTIVAIESPYLPLV